MFISHFGLIKYYTAVSWSVSSIRPSLHAFGSPARRFKNKKKLEIKKKKQLNYIPIPINPYLTEVWTQFLNIHFCVICL